MERSCERFQRQRSPRRTFSGIESQTAREGRYSALYLKVLGDTPAERLTLVLLANSDGLQWETRFDEAAIERSPFATAFLDFQ